MDESDAPSAEHQRPDGVDDLTVEALGTLTKAFETVEYARGLLYGFHRLTGSADGLLGEAIDQLREAGHTDLADELAEKLLGRNVIPGRWTFQILEEYDDGYYELFRDLEKRGRDELVGGRRHLREAEIKEGRRTHGRPGHEAQPDEND